MRRLTEAEEAQIYEWECTQGRWREIGHDLPLNRFTLAVALAVVAVSAALSSIWPMGFAS